MGPPIRKGRTWRFKSTRKRYRVLRVSAWSLDIEKVDLMNGIYSLLMLGCILVAVIFYVVRFKQTRGIYTETSQIPILSGVMFGLVLGALLGVFLDLYVLPSDWWYNSDLPRNIELGVIGAIFGIILGGVFSVFFCGRKMINRKLIRFV